MIANWKEGDTVGYISKTMKETELIKAQRELIENGEGEESK